MKKIAVHFGDEIRAVYPKGLPISWTEDGTIYGREDLSADDNTALDMILAAHDPDKKPEKKASYSKAQLFTEMTNPEFDLYEYISLSQPARERGIFEMTTAIQPDHALYQKFEQLVLTAYGPTRGKELLEAAAIKA